MARRTTIAVAGILSCLVFYPFIHECGHMLPAVASGAEVNRLIWTPLLGRTHVSFNNVPGSAMPWVDAGGVLLPTVVGTVLIGIWLALPKTPPNSLRRLWLLIPGGIMLLGNVGLVFEMVSQSNELDHMHALGHLIGGDGIAAVLIELSPAIWSFVVLAYVIQLCWRHQSPKPQRLNTT